MTDIAVIHIDIFENEVGGDFSTFTPFLNRVVGEGRWIIMGNHSGAGSFGAMVLVPCDGESAGKLQASLNRKPGWQFLAERRRSNYITSATDQPTIDYMGWTERVSQADFDRYWAPYPFELIARGKRPITRWDDRVQVQS